MNKLKVALIGAGQIARVSHIPAYKEMNGVEIVGISDTNIEAAKQLASEFDIPFYSNSHEELLEKCEIDAVSVCVPNKFHYSIVMDALEAGCNVMCEKPPAITPEEAKTMSDTATSKGLLLSYDFHFRHGSNVAIMKDKIQNGDFGDIYFTRVKWLRRAGVPGWGNFINKDMQGGGPMIDIGAHMLDLALYLLDYPEISYVSASSSNRIGKKYNKGLMGTWDNTKYTVEDGLFGFIHFKNGTCLELETTFALNMKEKDTRAVDIFGDKLGGSLFPCEVYCNPEDNFGNIEYGFNNDKDLHTIALENFVRSCMGEEELLVTGQQGAYIQQVINYFYQSAEEGKPVFAE